MQFSSTEVTARRFLPIVRTAAGTAALTVLFSG
jgi:hypothetical protein